MTPTVSDEIEKQIAVLQKQIDAGDTRIAALPRMKQLYIEIAELTESPGFLDA